jgi:hypothetical protein
MVLVLDLVFNVCLVYPIVPALCALLLTTSARTGNFVYDDCKFSPSALSIDVRVSRKPICVLSVIPSPLLLNQRFNKTHLQ